MAHRRKKLNSKKLPKRIITFSVVAALCTALSIVGVKSFDTLLEFYSSSDTVAEVMYSVEI